MTKLKCYELKEMLGLHSGYEIFKSGKDVKIHFDEAVTKEFEEKTLDFLRRKGLSVTPETIPTNGYYTVEWKNDNNR